jgi:arginine-tRNA-protein transferase
VSIERRNFPQFFITAPAPCPYLPGRLERKVFTHLVGQDARTLNTQLSRGGFRRSQNIAYRPACDGCSSCVSVRTPVKQFKWSKSLQRVLARNKDLVGTPVRAKATSEHYAIFRDYIDSRHGDGGMAEMSVLDFAAMIDETFVDSHLVEYRFKWQRAAGELWAPSVDMLDDGLSTSTASMNPASRNAASALSSFSTVSCGRREWGWTICISATGSRDRRRWNTNRGFCPRKDSPPTAGRYL